MLFYRFLLIKNTLKSHSLDAILESKRSKATTVRRSTPYQSRIPSRASSGASTPATVRSLTAARSRRNSNGRAEGKALNYRSIESSPAVSERSCSPSRALQAIKEKLNRFIEAPKEGLFLSRTRIACHASSCRRPCIGR